MSQFNIEISKTSNPHILKFTANSFLTKSSSYEFHSAEEAEQSPLAQQLFYLPFVKTVYISQNFIAIEKHDILAWEDVQQEVADSILDYLDSGRPVLLAPLPPKKAPITVYAESTPNPAVMKFVANKKLASEVYEFKNIEEVINSPLAQALLKFPFVKEVFFNNNYISVTKYEEVEWQEIMMELREFIRRFLETKEPIINNKSLSAKVEPKNSRLVSPLKTHSEFEKEIIKILDEYIKPSVETDGGNISLDSFDSRTKTVKVILQGACSGCPSSTATLKNGIESVLKQLLPNKIDTVIAING